MQEPYQYCGFVHNQRLITPDLETFPIAVNISDNVAAERANMCPRPCFQRGWQMLQLERWLLA